MGERLFSASVDGTLKVWDIGDLQGDIIPEMQPDMTDSKFKTGEQTNVEKRSDVDSGIDDREYRDRRAQNMV